MVSSGTDTDGGGTAVTSGAAPIPYQELIERSPFPMALIDRGGEYRLVNRKFREIFGWSLDDVSSGREWFARAFPDEEERREAVRAWREDLGADDTAVVRPRMFRVRCRDGVDRYILFRPVILEGGSRLVVYEDLSGLVFHHEALKAANRRLTEIIEFLPDPTLVIDREGRVIAWNRAIEKLTGVSKEEMLGRSDRAYAIPFFGAPHPMLIDLALTGGEDGIERYTSVERRGMTIIAEACIAEMNGRTDVHLWGVASRLCTPEGEVAGAIESIRDITEQRRNQQELRWSEARYRELVESINDIVYVIDPAGTITYVSPVILQVSGYSQQDVIGRSYLELVHLEDRAIALERLEALAAGRDGPSEFRMHTRSGEERWVRSYTHPVVVDGRVTELRGVLTDITARKIAETSLRRSEALLARMADATPFGYYVFDPQDDRILYVNDRFCSIWGVEDLSERLRAAEVRHSEIASHLRGLVPGPDSFPDAQGPTGDGEGRGGTEEEIELLDGRTIRRFQTLIRDEEGRFFAHLHLCEDISEHRRLVAELREYRDRLEDLVRQRTAELTRTNDELRREIRERLLATRARVESEERFSRIFQQAPIGMALFSLENRFLRVNEALCRITGYCREELLAMGPFDITHPDDVEAGRELSEQVIRGKIEGYVREKRYLRKDGTAVCVQVTIGPVRDPAGGSVSLLSMVEDVTERKKNEEQLRVYAGALQESNQDLQRFAYAASHDLQEPLRTIVSFTQLLERRLAGLDEPEVREFLEFIIDGGTRMQHLIQDLLVYSRVVTTGQPLEPTDAGRAVEDTLRALGAAIMESGARVTVGPLPKVKSDPGQLRQVFANLVGNAIKYRLPGRPPEIRVTAEPDGAFWRFEVSDNGIGIAPDNQARIFEVFQRLHTRAEYEGTGIGLAVVKRIVERHGGRIWVESRPGEGSSFFFTMPAA